MCVPFYEIQTNLIPPIHFPYDVSGKQQEKNYQQQLRKGKRK
jgi:hypothetical protein